MNITIRPLEADDRDRWSDLFRGYLAFYKVDEPAEGFDKVWNWIFDPSHDFWCNVAVDDNGELVGLVHYQLWYNSLYSSMACYMADLFVDQEVRGNGAGRKLIDSVLVFAREQGLPSVEWLTQESNYPGRRLYDTYSGKSEFIFYIAPT